MCVYTHIHIYIYFFVVCSLFFQETLWLNFLWFLIQFLYKIVVQKHFRVVPSTSLRFLWRPKDKQHPRIIINNSNGFPVFFSIRFFLCSSCAFHKVSLWPFYSFPIRFVENLVETWWKPIVFFLRFSDAFSIALLKT